MGHAAHPNHCPLSVCLCAFNNTKQCCFLVFFSCLTRCSCVILLFFLSLIYVQSVEEEILCYGTYLPEVRQQLHYRVHARAAFQRPLLQPDGVLVEFGFQSGRDTPEPIVRTVCLENVGQLLVRAKLRCEGVFELCSPETMSDLAVEPRQSVPVEIRYDPLHTTERFSRVDEGELIVTYEQAGPQDRIALLGRVTYPNIRLSAKTVDFGTVLSGTHSTKTVVVENESEEVLSLSWSLLADKNVSVQQVFDIRPSAALLAPHEVLQCEFTYFGLQDRVISGQAVCQVAGGPAYKLPLLGQATGEQFSLSNTRVLFTGVSDARAREQHVTLTNEQSLSLEYAVLTESQRVSISPMRGTLGGHEAQEIAFTLNSAAPDRFEDSIFIQVGRDLPRCITVVSNSDFPTLSIQAPRVQAAEEADTSASADASSWRAAIADACAGLPETRVGSAGTAVSDSNNSNGSSDRAAITLNANLRNKSPSAIWDTWSSLDNEGQAQMSRFCVEVDRATIKHQLVDSARTSLSKVRLLPYRIALPPVVQGKDCVTHVHVSNPFERAVSFAIPPKTVAKLADQGISIAPESVSDLPQGRHVALAVTLNTHVMFGALYPLGPLNVTVPLQLTSGPKVLLQVQGEVCLPQLSLAVKQHEFGRVQIGQV